MIVHLVDVRRTYKTPPEGSIKDSWLFGPTGCQKEEMEFRAIGVKCGIHPQGDEICGLAETKMPLIAQGHFLLETNY